MNERRTWNENLEGKGENHYPSVVECLFVELRLFFPNLDPSFSAHVSSSSNQYLITNPIERNESLFTYTRTRDLTVLTWIERLMILMGKCRQRVKKVAWIKPWFSEQESVKGSFDEKLKLWLGNRKEEGNQIIDQQLTKPLRTWEFLGWILFRLFKMVPHHEQVPWYQILNVWA